MSYGKILKGGDELFFHPAVVKFYSEVINNWKVDDKPIALLLGCTLHKPYSKSFIHKKVIGMLRKYELDRYVQQYIIGEPLVVVPREWENIYPAAHYDFPPSKLTDKGREVFILRLNLFFQKAVRFHNAFIIFAPNHHREIILNAANGLFKPIIVPYNIYKLPLLLKTILGVLNDKVQSY